MIYTFLDRIFYVHLNKRFAQDGLPIPKEAPWKTSALSKQTFTVCALSTATSGTERERGFVGIGSPSCASLSHRQVCMLVF